MGKEESAEATGETEADPETSEETTAEAKEQSTPEGNATPEATEQPVEEKKEDVEKLRTVIKVNEEESPAEETPSEEKKEESPPPTEEKKEEAPKPTVPAAPAGGSRDDLEQRRSMLQSIKDFDFQIKKNQEDIGKMVEKLDGLTKDLDDLVSLYEIVSEQMNPFVGLSKVTKKRIDALENFTQEIEDIKTRMGDVESIVEKSVGGIKKLTKKFDTKELTPCFSETADKPELELEEIKIPEEESTSETVAEPKVQIAEPVSTPTTAYETQLMNGDLSDDDLDILLSKSLESLLAEQSIDYIINEFLLSLK